MVDYAKKTVAELQEILKSRSLPSSGKKAELVARLTEADQTAEDEEQQAPLTEATSALPKQAQSTKEPASDAQATSAAPTTQPTSETVTSPSANVDATTTQSASYALHLPSSEVDAEMVKRKARAERFGTGAPANDESGATDTTQAESDKALERAKRFGTGFTSMGKLDEALPTEREKGGRKRGKATEENIANAALEDPGLRRGFRGRVGGSGGGGGGAGGNRGGRRNNSRKGERPTGVQKPGGGAAMSEKDRLAAEARKKRFATAT